MLPCPTAQHVIVYMLRVSPSQGLVLSYVEMQGLFIAY